MAYYKYRSIDEAGKLYSGRMQATNILDIEHRLANLKQDLITCDEVKPVVFRFGRRKLARKEIINMVFQLEQLTKSGVPLLDGLRDIRDSTDPGYYKDVLAGVVESIEGGKTFSAALADFPSDFDTVFVSLIGVGEESGELSKILKDMGETLRWTDELISATIKILMYPAIVAVVVFCVTAFLMIYLVPQIIPFVNEMGGEIPMHTRALISVSWFFVHYWWVVAGGPVTVYFVISYLAKRNENLRFNIDKLKLKLPLFGAISFKIKLARFANYMALLYASGITVLRSLDICKKLVDNLMLAKAIEDAKTAIGDGKSISDSFASVNVFPPLVIRMLRVGENTGNLDEALGNVRYFYDREVQESIDKIEPAISPVLTVIMGSLLGWIMMAVLGPVWDAVSRVS